MKKICFLLCLLLSFTTLFACRDNSENDSPDETDQVEQEDGIVLSVTDEITIGVGDTKQITAINAKTGMETSNVIWTSDNTSVATVGYDGRLTGIADGTAVISASTIDGSAKASCTVKVTSVLVGISLSPTEVVVESGKEVTLEVGFTPETYTGAVLTWVSGDESIASVKDGVITAHADGSTTIAVSAEGFTAVCAVTVVTPVSSVTLSEELIPLTKGKTLTLTATVLPTNASDKSLTWTSSNPTSVKVSDTGEITALAGGTATITAKTSNGITATCTVVVSVPVTGVSLNPSEVTIDPNGTQKLTASISPADANVQDIIWTCSDLSVVTVTATGEIKGLKPGTATITVTTVEGYFTATCKVTVANSITGLSFEETEGNLLIGQSLTLIPVKTPADANDSVYTWDSSAPEIASVDENGKVTALAAGKAVITVTTDKGITASFTLTSIDPATIDVPIQKIQVANMAVNAGETFSLNITITPSNATEEPVIKSGNTSRVIVNSDGTLTALRKGTVTITVSTKDGKVSATCLVTINEMTSELREQMTKEYNAELKTIEAEHNTALNEIGQRYDSDIQFYTDAVQNASVVDEATYQEQKSELEKKISACTDSNEKKSLEDELTELESDWSAYQFALQNLTTLQQSKDAELTAENESYQNNITELKNRYPFLF